MDDLTPVSPPDWTVVIDEVLPCLGAWTGQETFASAASLVVGFDLAGGGRVAPLLLDWTQSRFGATNIQWPWQVLLVAQVLRIDEAELASRDINDLTPEEDGVAVATLRKALMAAVTALR